MRCCNLHLPALVEWPEGMGIEACPLCEALREIAILASERDLLKERLIDEQAARQENLRKQQRLAEWMANIHPGGQL